MALLPPELEAIIKELQDSCEHSQHTYVHVQARQRAGGGGGAGRGGQGCWAEAVAVAVGAQGAGLVWCARGSVCACAWFAVWCGQEERGGGEGRKVALEASPRIRILASTGSGHTQQAAPFAALLPLLLRCICAAPTHTTPEHPTRPVPPPPCLRLLVQHMLRHLASQGPGGEALLAMAQRLEANVAASSSSGGGSGVAAAVWGMQVGVWCGAAARGASSAWTDGRSRPTAGTRGNCF